MFDGIAASILTNLFGDYIEGLNSKNLSLSVASGKVQLRHLMLKKTILEPLELPLYVKDAYLDELNMKIPWTNLNSKPAVIKLSGIYILVGPKTSHEHDEEAIHNTKMRSLEIAEVVGMTEPDKVEEKPLDKKKTGYFEGIAMNVVDNLQIIIEDVHFRYEDRENDFTFGFSLDSAQMTSAGEKWDKNAAIGEKIMRKMLQIVNFGVYFNMNPSFCIYNGIEEFMQLMRDNTSNEENTFILHPSSGQLKLDLNMTDRDYSRPKVIMDFVLDITTLEIDSVQYLNLIGLLNYFTTYTANVKWSKHKPDPNSSPKEEPDVWWKYLISGMKDKVESEREKWSYKYYKERSRAQQEYMEIYKKKKLDKKLNSNEQRFQDEIERKYPFDDLITWRKLANASLQMEKEHRDAQPKQGFFAGLFGKKKEEPQLDISMKDLYGRIGFEENTENDIPSDYKQIDINILLRGGFLRILDQKRNPILMGSFEELALGVDLYSECVDVLLSLQSLGLVGQDDKEETFTIIQMDDSVENMNSHHLLDFHLSLSPLDREVDMYTKIDVRPVVINYNKNVIERLLRFLTIEEAIPIEELTGASLENITQQAQSALKYALEERPKIELDINISAPTVNIPINNSSDYEKLVLNLGHLELKSDLTSRENAVSKTGVDFNVNTEYFYDTYKLGISDICANFHSSATEEHPVLRDLDIEINLKMREETATSSDLPFFIVDINIPSVQVTMTQKKVLNLLKTLDAFQIETPEIGNVPAPIVKENTVETQLSVEELLKIKEKNEEIKVFVGSFILGSVSVEYEVEGGDSFSVEIMKLDVGVSTTTVKNDISLSLGLFCLKSSGTSIIESELSTTGKSIEMSYIQNSVEKQDNIKFDIAGLSIIAKRTILINIISESLDLIKSMDNGVSLPEAQSTSVSVIPTEDTPEEVSSNMNIKLSLRLVKVILDDGKPFLQFSATDLETEISLIQNTMKLKSSLGNISALYNDDTYVWKDIISINGDNVFSFEYATYDKMENYPGYDSSINLSITSVQAVVLGDTLVHLLTFFVPFQDILGSASSAVATEVSSSAPELLKLDIHISNPIVIIPISPTSTDHLILDFGEISLRNSFTYDQNTIDTKIIRVDNMRVISVFEGEDYSIIQQGNIKLDSTQNLTDLTDPDVTSINIGSLNWVLNRTAVALLINIFNYNLSSLLTHLSTDNSNEVIDIGIEKNEPVNETETKDSIMSVSIESLIFTINNGECDLISLQLPKANVSMVSINGASKIEGGLQDFMLKDVRDNKGYLDTLISTDPVSDKGFIDFTMESEGTNSSIDLKIGHLILSPIPSVLLEFMEYLFPLKDSLLQLVDTLTSQSTDGELEEKKVQEENDSSITLNCEILSPTFYLFEDFEAEASDAYVLNLGSFVAKYSSSSESKMTVYAKLEDFELGSTYYKYVEKKQKNTIQVIQPIGVEIRVDQSTEENTINFFLEHTDVIISYQDVLSLSRLKDSWSSYADQFTSITNGTLEDINVETPQVDLNISQKVLLHTKKISLSIVDDYTNPDLITPIINFSVDRTSVMINGNGIETDMDINIEGIRLDSFNRNINLWEAALEPLNISAKGFTKTDEELKFRIISEKIYFNFASVIIGNFFDLAGHVQSALEGKNQKVIKDKSGNRYESPYVIANHTGYPISLQWDSTDVNLEDSEMLFLKISQTSRSQAIVNQETYTVKPVIEDFHELPEFEIGTVSTHIIPHVDISNPGYRLTCDIYNEFGSKIVMFRSPYSVSNNLNESIHFKVSSKGNPEFKTKIRPGTRRGIPLVHSASKFDMFIRRDSNYEWKLVDINTANVICESQDSSWMCSVSQSSKRFHGYTDSNIAIDYPFQFENGFATPIEIKMSLLSGRDEMMVLSPGEEYQFALDIRDISLKLPGLKWSSPIDILGENRTQEVVLHDEFDDSPTTVFAYIMLNNTTKLVALYSKYWIINNTGVSLFYNQKKKYVQAGQTEIVDRELSSEQHLWYQEPISLDYYGSDGTKNIFYYGHDEVVMSKHGHKSEQISLTTVNGMCQLEEKHIQYNFSVSETIGSQQFWRTTVVRFYPAFVFVNNTDIDLFFKQVDTSELQTLSSGAQQPFHWPEKRGVKSILISLDGDDYTVPIDITSLGKFKICLPHNGSLVTLMISITFHSENGITFLSVEQNVPEFLGYKIRNETDAFFRIEQVKGTVITEISPNSEIEYIWELPQDEKLLKVEYLSSKGKYKPSKAINVDEIREHSNVVLSKKKVYRRIIVEDYSKVLIFSYIKQDQEELVEQTSVSVELSIMGIGISVMTDIQKHIELMYINISDTELDFRVTDKQTYINFSIDKFQVDNQLYLTPYPILVYTPKSEKKFLELCIVKKNSESESISWFRYIGVGIQELDICIDQIFLTYLLDFASKVLTRVQALTSSNSMGALIKGEQVDVLNLYVREDHIDTDIVYVELFMVNSGRATASFATALKRTYDEIDTSTMDWILKIVGFMANMERTPFFLPGLFLENPFLSKQELIERISSHYTTSILSQIYKVVGNMNFLGSPVSLIDSLGSGMVSFIQEPAKGIVSSPEDFALGVAKGTGALVKGTIYGVFNSATKITSSISKVGETLTFDKDYRREREISKQKEAQHVGEGLAYGVRDFGKGLWSGVSGLVTEPIKGGKKGGALGVFKGIGKGLTGVVLKPTIGVVDIVTRTTEGIKNTATYFENQDKERTRYPRYFDGKTGAIITYEPVKAYGQFLLHTIADGKYEEEDYLYHVVYSKQGSIILLSDFHIFKLKKDISGDMVMEWTARRNRAELKEVTGLTAHLRTYGLNFRETSKTIKFKDEETLQDCLTNIFSGLTLNNEYFSELTEMTDTESESTTATPSSQRRSKTVTGWLNKRGEKIHSWQKRHFTLQEGEMIYRKTETGKLVGSFTVRGNLVTECHDFPKRKHCFQVVTQEGRTYYMETKSEEETEMWLQNCQLHGGILQ
eukprot:TRINITY_DN510_c0_g1_i5.p1 TRINITY_DN510_c0_g1~~TRINITY_DN510_c0_g1_i5.p1  ORF type:complete len:2967 (-),score=626.80 TRINITY_DN510_c0_g1_i5:1646-10546(-)